MTDDVREPTTTTIGNQPGGHHPTECALVHKAQLGPIISEPKAHSEVFFIGHGTRAHQQLAAHAQMGDECDISTRERKP